jgi:hypothetical protein
MASPHDPRQKRLATAFTQALYHDQQLRVAWLAVLRSQCRNGGPAVPVKPEDDPLLQRLERRLPNHGSIRLGAFLVKLRMRAPNVVPLAPDIGTLELRLISWALQYQAGKSPDPCTPWMPRGRPGGKSTRHYSPEELMSVMEKAITMWIDRHPTHRQVIKTDVAKMMGTTYRQLQAWLTDDGVDFDELCASVRQKNHNPAELSSYFLIW